MSNVNCLVNFPGFIARTRRGFAMTNNVCKKNMLSVLNARRDILEDVPYLFICSKEKFKDVKGVIRSRKSNDRQYNGQTKMDKKTNNDA